MRAAQAETEEAVLGSHLLRPIVLPRCSPVLTHCSLSDPPCSLNAPSKAALLPFLIESGNFEY